MDKRNLVIDLVALAIYLVVATPVLTGIGVHEWLGMGTLVVFFVHVFVHVDWAVEALRTVRVRLSWVRGGNLVLDLAILVTFAMVMVSGLLISGAVLPALDLYATGYYFWDPLHAVAAKVLLAFLLVHVVVHWKWFAKAFGKGRGKCNGDE